MGGLNNPGGGNAGWTDDRKELLKKLLAQGLSASQIAKQIGGVSRNAVIGKIHRMGLSAPAPAPKPKRYVAPRATPIKPVSPTVLIPKIPPAPIVVAEIVPEGDLKPLPEEERHPRHWCRWPIGDPLSPSFGTCGREQAFKAEGSYQRDPYCAHHRAEERGRAKKSKMDAGKLAGWIDKQDGRRPNRIAGGPGAGGLGHVA